LAAPLGQRSHRRIGGATTGGRGTRRASTRGTSARGAGSPSSVSSGIESPPFSWCVIGAERVERSPRVLQTRMQPLHHAPFPETAEHGEHPLSICWEARHGPFGIRLRGDAGHGIPASDLVLYELSLSGAEILNLRVGLVHEGIVASDVDLACRRCGDGPSRIRSSRGSRGVCRKRSFAAMVERDGR